jgi:hypothetical protein
MGLLPTGGHGDDRGYGAGQAAGAGEERIGLAPVLPLGSYTRNKSGGKTAQWLQGMFSTVVSYD